MEWVGLILGTLASEDLTCITAGLLIQRGQLGAITGILGCLAGIFLGDLGLWMLGRVVGRRVLRWAWVSRILTPQRLKRFADWLDQRGWWAVLSSRFLPGTRVPMYIAAGVLGQRSGRFVAWLLLAAGLWTPLLVGSVALVGSPLVKPLEAALGSLPIGIASMAILVLLVLRIGTLACTTAGRARLSAKIERVWRWEFWPAWLFYLPLVPWLAYLAVRYRGFTTLTAANPGIPHGGVVGESKFEILSKLPTEWVVPSALIRPANVSKRVEALSRIMTERGWAFPLILKPDAGQRGVGVKLVKDAAAAADYLDQDVGAILVQVYHPGPFEAGIFYYRVPGESRGRILSITDKRFPVVMGDGTSTVENLIWRHPRYRMQADTFLARMNGRASQVLPRGDRLRLAIAGNHCQGTMFCDGAHLVTPGLEAVIDRIARRFDGFFFGRFDVRYRDLEAFKAGKDFAIVELNGATSESTNIYDPSWSLAAAYRVLFRQWALLFEIGQQNRQRGHRPSSLRQLIQETRAHYRNRRVNLISD